MSAKIDRNAVDWIAHSSLDDAKGYIRKANEPTLRAAAEALHKRRGGTKSYFKLINTRLRVLDREVTAVRAGGPLSVRCPSCGAAPGIHCKRPSGHRIFGGGEHDARCNKAEEAAHVR
jgi:hypothetical protein